MAIFSSQSLGLSGNISTLSGLTKDALFFLSLPGKNLFKIIIHRHQHYCLHSVRSWRAIRVKVRTSRWPYRWKMVSGCFVQIMGNKNDMPATFRNKNLYEIAMISWIVLRCFGPEGGLRQASWLSGCPFSKSSVCDGILRYSHSSFVGQRVAGWQWWCVGSSENWDWDVHKSKEATSSYIHNADWYVL